MDDRRGLGEGILSRMYSEEEVGWDLPSADVVIYCRSLRIVD
jgi:hypothetical protein